MLASGEEQMGLIVNRRVYSLAAIVIGVAVFLFGHILGNRVWLFAISGIATVLLAKVIGDATERLSKHFGSVLGALLGITFGNSVELILSLFALYQGLYTVVKASIIGSVLANLLLTLGVSMMVGGGAKGVQQFNRRRAGLNSAMLFVAVIGLTTASVFSFLRFRTSGTEALSVGVAAVFLLVYVGGFFFSFLTHRTFLAELSGEGEPVKASPILEFLLLFAATVAVALVSDQLVATIEPVAVHLRLSQQFIGLVFLPLIGVAPEFFAALTFARNGEMEGSVESAVGSSLQISLFVAPLLVIVGLFMGRTLTLVFTPAQVTVLFLSTILVNIVSLDGETHWFEGVMVVATYVIFALMFFLA